MTVGERIKQLRKLRRLSADYVAQELGVSRSTIFRYENGDIEKVPAEIIDKLSGILGTTPGYLMGWADEIIPFISEKNPKRTGTFKLNDDGVYSEYTDDITYPSLFTPDNAALAHRFLAENRINALGGLNTDNISDEEAVTYANIIQKNMQDAEERSNTEIQLAMFQKFRDEKNK